MSFIVIQGLFVLGVVLFVTGFFMNIASGSGGISNVGQDVASALGLIVVYAFVIVSVDKSMDFVRVCGDGIPFISEINEFGSLKDTFYHYPDRFVEECFELIVLSMVVDLVKFIFGARHIFVNKKFSMTLFFTYFIASMIGVIIFDFIVKESALYKNIASTLGAVSATAAVAMMVIMLIFRKPAGLLGPVSKFFTGAVFKTLLYIAVIWCMETFLGGVSDGIDLVTELLVGFGPIVVLLVGLGIMLKSVKF